MYSCIVKFRLTRLGVHHHCIVVLKNEAPAPRRGSEYGFKRETVLEL